MKPFFRNAASRIVLLLLPLVLLACSQRMSAPTAAPSGDLAPVALRNFEVTAVDGHRAVLLRLSRLPTLVRQSSSNRPARITVEAWGPEGDSDLPERDLPQVDPFIERRAGVTQERRLDGRHRAQGRRAAGLHRARDGGLDHDSIPWPGVVRRPAEAVTPECCAHQSPA